MTTTENEVGHTGVPVFSVEPLENQALKPCCFQAGHIPGSHWDQDQPVSVSREGQAEEKINDWFS